MADRDVRFRLGVDASSLHLRTALGREAGVGNESQQLRDWAALGSLCEAAGWRLVRTLDGVRAAQCGEEYGPLETK